MGKHMRIVMGAVIVLVLAALACGTPSKSSSAVLLEDDFSSTSTGWEVGSWPGGSVGYKSGAYSVVSNGGGDTMWGVANSSFSDVVINVDTQQVSAPANDNNGYGVVCREQGDGNGYYLLISGDGGYAIVKAQNDRFVPLVEWTRTDAVKQGNASNHIEATCNGTTLTLVVNGTRVATVEDSTYSKGDIALTVTSYEDGEPSEVLFDNVKVTKP
jgi:hypothetical protein